MNERIKEMYNQCFVELENDTPNIGFDFEKFAELIIRECSDVADENYIHRGSRTCGLAIRLHFGVEE